MHRAWLTHSWLCAFVADAHDQGSMAATPLTARSMLGYRVATESVPARLQLVLEGLVRPDAPGATNGLPLTHYAASQCSCCTMSQEDGPSPALRAFFDACTPSPEVAIVERAQRLLQWLTSEHSQHQKEWRFSIRLYYRYARRAACSAN